MGGSVDVIIFRFSVEGYRLERLLAIGKIREYITGHSIKNRTNIGSELHIFKGDGDGNCKTESGSKASSQLLFRNGTK